MPGVLAGTSGSEVERTSGLGQHLGAYGHLLGAPTRESAVGPQERDVSILQGREKLDGEMILRASATTEQLEEMPEFRSVEEQKAEAAAEQS